MTGEPAWQLAWYDVADTTVQAAGERLDHLIDRTPKGLNDLSLFPHPIEGWRLIHGPGPVPAFEQLSVLGAPWPQAGPGLWALIDITSNNGRIHVVTTSPVPLRPGRVLRRRGLILTWPIGVVEHQAGQPLQHHILVRNTGEHEWTGDGLDGSGVSARILQADGTPLPRTRRWGFGGQAIRPLGPIPSGGTVDLMIAQWANARPETLTPGDYLMDAELQDLKLTCPPAQLKVTP